MLPLEAFLNRNNDPKANNPMPSTNNHNHSITPVTPLPNTFVPTFNGSGITYGAGTSINTTGSSWAASPQTEPRLQELVELLDLKPVDPMAGYSALTLLATDGQSYSLLDIMLAMANMITRFEPTRRICSDCGEENPHQLFDYICIKCRDQILTKQGEDD